MAHSTASLIEELDYAIAEFQGAMGRELSDSVRSSLAAAHDLRTCLHNMQDQSLDSIRLEVSRACIPLPAWMPHAVTRALSTSSQIPASEALSKALKSPRENDIEPLKNVIRKVQGANNGNGNHYEEQTPPPHESAGPSGLSAADRVGEFLSFSSF